MTLSDVSATLAEVESQLRVVNSSYDNITSTAPALLSNISDSRQLLAGAQEVKTIFGIASYEVLWEWPTADLGTRVLRTGVLWDDNDEQIVSLCS